MSTSKFMTIFFCAVCVVAAFASAETLRAQDARAVASSGVVSSATVASPVGTVHENGAVDSRDARAPGTAFPGYRFWMAPSESIDRWPWGDGKYLPIESSTFNGWLSATRRRGILQDYVDGLRFSGVVASLRLSGKLSDGALEGVGSLVTVACPIDDASSSDDVALTTPPISSFAVATTYPEGYSVAPEDELATYPDGLFYLPNGEDRTRRFRWSRRGKVDGSGNLYYEFNFQSFLYAELLLETDASVVVTSADGVVLPLLGDAEETSDGVDGESQESGIRKWRVCFRGRGQSRVTIVRRPAANAVAVARPVGYRQESSYRLSLSGVELSTRFDFERVPSPFAETTVALEAPLEFTSLEWGSTPARPVSTEVGEDGATLVRVRVPSNLVGDAPVSLRVNAFCPIWFGERRVPTARALGSWIDWRESLMRVAVSAPLTSTSITPVEASQTRDASRARTEGLSVATFKLFEPEGSVRLALRQGSVAPPFDSATDCYFVANEISAKTTLFFSFDGVNRNNVSIPLAKGWDVDSAQTPQEDAVAWFRETDSNGRRSIRLAFKNPPTPRQPTRVTLAARYVAPLEERPPVERLCPLDLRESLSGAHALSIRADSSSQIRYTTRDGKPFVPAKTTTNAIFGESLLREATPLAPGGLRLWIGDQTVDAFASLENVRSNYSVELSCACVLEEDRLLESWKLRCSPSSGMRVDRIVFFVSLTAEENNTVASELEWFWSTSIEPERRWRAPRLSEEEANALHAPENAAAYEIRLTTSRSVPFELNVFCAVPATRETTAPLIFFPDSTSRSVEVVVESNSSSLFKTEGVAIAESTVPTDGSSDSWFLKKAFRYDPTALFGASQEETTDVGEEGRSEEELRRNAEELSALVARKQGARVVPSLKLTLIERERLDSNDVLPLNSLCWFENYDSFYQNDGVVRHCATFYLENRGRDFIRLGLSFPNKSKFNAADRGEGFFSKELEFADEWEHVDCGPIYESINAVWADDARAPWTLWKLPRASDEPERYVLDVRLLAKRRYVRVELDYCDSSGKRLSGSRRVRPIQIECDVPALSGVWNAWFPPQFQTRRTYFRQKDANLGLTGRFNALVDSLLFRASDKDELEKVAERVASRLGDAFALRLAISQARRVDSGDVAKTTAPQTNGSKDSGKTGKEESAPNDATKPSPEAATSATIQKRSALSEVDALNIDAPTWGDVLGSPSLIANLFAPEFHENADASSQDDAKNVPVESAFGKLDGAHGPTTLLIDRYALISVGVTPNRPLPTVEGNDPLERANLLLESANIKLILATPRLALATTGEALTRQYGSEFTSLCRPSICAPSSRGVARRMEEEILDPNSRRYVEPGAWRDLVETTTPWSRVGFDASDGSFVQGWTFTSLPIGRASEGVYIVNRYVLVALEFFGFVGFVFFFWRRDVATPKFLIGTMGLCLAILCPARYELASLTRGVFYGSLCLFSFRSFRILFPSSKRSRGEVARSALLETDPEYDSYEDSAKKRAYASDSSEGYVDFARMSPEELHYIQSGASGLSNDRDGKTTMKTLLALLAFALVVVATAAGFARGSENEGANGSSAPSSLGEEPAKEPYREPYRVFAPIDASRQRSGDYYWIESSFYDQIRSDLRTEPRERSWRVVDALYEGVVSYNSFSGATSIFSLKATYTLVMDSDVATISLPAVQISPDGGARFDKQSASASYSEDGSEIRFEIQAKPGVHVLELSVVPPQFFETSSRLALPILPVASARLELEVSPDAPALDAPNAIGKVERTSRLFTAELGPVDQLIVAKAESQARSEKTKLDAEQYFLLRSRPSQTDVRATFHCQAIGGRLQTLEIDCDPAYAFSGYCKCDVGEIESVDSPTATNSAMRVSFKSPVSGSFTVNVDFVARNFSGVGRAPIPRISMRDARVVKNWLALSPDPGVECASPPGAQGMVAAFQNAWGQLDSRIVAVYDLEALDELAPIEVRLARSFPETEETTTCVFFPAFTKVDFNAALNSSSDLFRVLLDVPKPFVVDSLTVTDESGANVALAEQCLSEDGLRLEFETAIRGKYALKVAGRTKQAIDDDAPFPVMSIRGALCRSRYARVYCAANVDLEWKSFPEEWTIADRELFATLGDEPTDVYPVEVYSAEASLSPPSGEDDATDQDASAEGENERAAAAADLEFGGEQNAESAPSRVPEIPIVTKRMNAPALIGVERVFLYPLEDPSSQSPSAEKWKATFQLRFQILHGRIDRLHVAADDLYALDPPSTASFFSVEDTTTPTGEKEYLFTPRRPITSEDGEVELCFTATFKSDPSGVCLPRFQTLTSALYEDLSNVSRSAYLATLRGSVPILWSSRNMEKENDPRLEYERKRDELVNSLSPGLRSMAMNGFAKKGEESESDLAGRETRSLTAREPAFPAVVSQAKRAGVVSFERYACGKDASAWLSSQSDRMKVELARYEFFVNERREIFGKAIFMIKPSANDKCVVATPPGYHVLEARVNGARRLVERAVAAPSESESGSSVDVELNASVAPSEFASDSASSHTRWSVELGDAPYVKRLEVSFLATGKTSTKRTLFNALRRRSESFDVDFLRLESADVKRVLWICAFGDFDSEYGEARWSVSQRSYVDSYGDVSESVVSHDCVPVRVNQSGGALCRVGFEDALTLLSAYENDSSQLQGSRDYDQERARSRWLTAWRESVGAMTPYMTNARNSASASILPDPLLHSIMVVNNGEFLPLEQIDANFPIPSWSLARVSEFEAAKTRVFKMLGLDESSVYAVGASSSSSKSLWALHTAFYSRVLFGSTDANVARIEINAKPKTFDFLASPYSAAIFLLMATAAILQLLDARRNGKGRRSVFHVAFMFIWSVCFFFLGWAFIALVGAFLLAVAPSAWSYFQRKRSEFSGEGVEVTPSNPVATSSSTDHVESASITDSNASTSSLFHEDFEVEIDD